MSPDLGRSFFRELNAWMNSLPCIRSAVAAAIIDAAAPATVFNTRLAVRAAAAAAAGAGGAAPAGDAGAAARAAGAAEPEYGE